MLLSQSLPSSHALRSHTVSNAKARFVIAAAAKKQKPQKKKLRKPKQQRIYVDYDVDEYEYDDEDELPSGAVQSVLVPGARVPNAPAPVDRPRERAPKPEDLYPVFPKPQQPTVTPISNDSSKWSWGADAPGSSGTAQQQQQDVAMWNPKTGFLKTREQIELEAAAAAAAAAARPEGHNDSSSSSSSSRLVEPLQSSAAVSAISQAPTSPQQQQAVGAATAAADLPSVSRDQVLSSCIKTSAGMIVGAAILHIFAQRYSAGIFSTDQAAINQLVRMPAGFESIQDAGYMLAAAGVVTAARLLLLQVNAEFSEATNLSNKQVLSPLGWADVVLIALLTGVSEEVLFRGGLVPLTWPDYRGVLLAGLVFGVLHNSGGRNAVFAAWATVVGWLYGAAFLATGNIWVAVGTHSLANFASAAVWIVRNKEHQGSKQ